MSGPVKVIDDKARGPEIANAEHLANNTDALQRISRSKGDVQNGGNIAFEASGDSLIETVGHDCLREKPLLPQDVGWHQNLNDLPAHLVEGVSNEALWMLIRRFNKNVIRVKRTHAISGNGYDLDKGPIDNPSSVKASMYVERAYLTIYLALASCAKQIARLRSWHERRRTTLFCIAFSIAWIFDLLTPLCFGTLSVVLYSRTARQILFPPTPRSLVNVSTGQLQKPPAGHLGSIDTLTGASEQHEGIAAEQEASNIIANVRHLVLRASGMHEKPNQEGNPLEKHVPSGMKKVLKALKAEGSTSGHAQEDPDPTQKPMEQLIWSVAHPEKVDALACNIVHGLGGIVDNCERFANAMSMATPAERSAIQRIQAILLSISAGSLFVNHYIVYKGAWFAFGFWLFGSPLIDRFLWWLNANYPECIQSLDPKNNVLRGVPTNSQLALTYLRVGEQKNSPLPPMPQSGSRNLDAQRSINIDNVPMPATQGEVLIATEALPDAEMGEDDQGDEKHPHLSKLTKISKVTAKLGLETKLAIDHVRAAAGSSSAKEHLGVVPKPKNVVYAGPSNFRARMDGKRGWATLTTGANPSIAFYHTDDSQPDETAEHTSDIPVCEILVKDIVQIKRTSAFANTSTNTSVDRVTSQDLLGSVEIKTKDEHTWKFTAMAERDAFFNRIVAIGDQRWENA